jgi:hypothetical protein
MPTTRTKKKKPKHHKKKKEKKYEHFDIKLVLPSLKNRWDFRLK